MSSGVPGQAAGHAPPLHRPLMIAHDFPRAVGSAALRAAADLARLLDEQCAATGGGTA